jgi:hypothetical protein
VPGGLRACVPSMREEEARSGPAHWQHAIAQQAHPTRWPLISWPSTSHPCRRAHQHLRHAGAWDQRSGNRVNVNAAALPAGAQRPSSCSVMQGLLATAARRSAPGVSGALLKPQQWRSQSTYWTNTQQICWPSPCGWSAHLARTGTYPAAPLW